jgi:hypothetical protein
MAQETPLFSSRSRQISLMAEGGAGWCRPAVILRLDLDPRRPELRRPVALSALMGNLRGVVARFCPQATFISVAVTSAGRTAANLNASAAGAWIFTTGRPIVASPLATAGAAAPTTGGGWAVPALRPPLPLPRPPASLGTLASQPPPPKTPPSMAVSPPIVAPSAKASVPPVQHVPAAAIAAAVEPVPPSSPSASPLAAVLHAAPLSVRLANAIAPAGSPFPDLATRLDNLRDARADAMITGQPRPVSMLIQANASGRDHIAASWPASLALNVPPAMPSMVAGQWYIARGTLSAEDNTADDAPSAQLQIQTLIACGQPLCTDAADPDTLIRRRQQNATP